MSDKYVFKSGAELIKLCKKYKESIPEITIKYEMEHGNEPLEEVLKRMRKVKDVMRSALEKGVRSDEKDPYELVGGDAHRLFKALESGDPAMLSNSLVIRAMAYATATGETNACMGRIVAFPTAGGAGVVPGVVFGYVDEFNLDEETHLNGLFTASAVGLIIAENATLSAAAAGCQAEVGAAIAMGAAAITSMRGGTPEQSLHAAAMGLKSYLGVVCDPLGGLVSIPCVKRNALGCATAIASSDMAIAGIASYIPFDEVVEAMRRIGEIMSPKLKETAMGGLAVTPTGLKVREKLGLPKLSSIDRPNEQPTEELHGQMIHWTNNME
jgi:L-serine dehydratase